jgi:hypothetical protein
LTNFGKKNDTGQKVSKSVNLRQLM